MQWQPGWWSSANREAADPATVRAAEPAKHLLCASSLTPGVAVPTDRTTLPLRPRLLTVDNEAAREAVTGLGRLLWLCSLANPARFTAPGRDPTLSSAASRV